MIGLAVGVDYTMFYLKREREERAEGRSEEDALQVAAATSGRSVLISGLTVMIAMSGMFLTGDPTFKGFGAATIWSWRWRCSDRSRSCRHALVARRPVEGLHIPVLEKHEAQARRGPVLERDSRPRPSPSDPGDPPVGGLSRRSVPRRPAAEDGHPRCGHLSAVAARGEDLQQDAEGLPRRRGSSRGRFQSRQRALGKNPRGDWTAPLASALDGRHVPADPTDINKAGTVAVVSIPLAGSGTDATSERR